MADHNAKTSTDNRVRLATERLALLYSDGSIGVLCKGQTIDDAREEAFVNAGIPGEVETVTCAPGSTVTVSLGDGRKVVVRCVDGGRESPTAVRAAIELPRQGLRTQCLRR